MIPMPRPTAPISGTLPPTKEWLDYFRQLAGAGDLDGINKAIAKLQEQIDEIEIGNQSQGVVLGVGAVVTRGMLSNGLVTVDLDDIADAGGGDLLKFSRDQYGRVVGTSNAEAPLDGNIYGRKDGDWEVVSGSSFGNLDGGAASSVYGGTTSVDGGGA